MNYLPALIWTSFSFVFGAFGASFMQYSPSIAIILSYLSLSKMLNAVAPASFTWFPSFGLFTYVIIHCIFLIIVKIVSCHKRAKKWTTFGTVLGSQLLCTALMLHAYHCNPKYHTYYTLNCIGWLINLSTFMFARKPLRNILICFSSMSASCVLLSVYAHSPNPLYSITGIRHSLDFCIWNMILFHVISFSFITIQDQNYFKAPRATLVSATLFRHLRAFLFSHILPVLHWWRNYLVDLCHFEYSVHLLVLLFAPKLLAFQTSIVFDIIIIGCSLCFIQLRRNPVTRSVQEFVFSMHLATVALLGYASCFGTSYFIGEHLCLFFCSAAVHRYCEKHQVQESKSNVPWMSVKEYNAHPFIKEVCQSTTTTRTEQNETLDCAICMDAPRDCIMLPCAHILGCKECVDELETCPICRSNVATVKKIFFC